MPDNYTKIIERISRISGLDSSEIERRIEGKRAKLSGLISLEGAAQIVAAELGISFENERLGLDELLPGMKRVNVIGKIIEIFPVREFNKNGKQGKVANIVIADSSTNVKAVLWDTRHIELIEKSEITKGSVIEISNASIRDAEIHLGSFSELKPSKEKIDNAKTEIIVSERKISEFENFGQAKTRAFIVQMFEPRFFEVCPQCRKKLQDDKSCAQHGKILPEKRAILSMIIDDGTETSRAVMFQDAIDSIGIKNLDNPEEFIIQKQELLGKELYFSGSLRINKLFNNREFIINKAEEINLDSVISSLEK